LRVTEVADPPAGSSVPDVLYARIATLEELTYALGASIAEHKQTVTEMAEMLAAEQERQAAALAEIDSLRRFIDQLTNPPLALAFDHRYGAVEVSAG
jgi:hypothetical protein